MPSRLLTSWLYGVGYADSDQCCACPQFATHRASNNEIPAFGVSQRKRTRIALSSANISVSFRVICFHYVSCAFSCCLLKQHNRPPRGERVSARTQRVHVASILGLIVSRRPVNWLQLRTCVSDQRARRESSAHIIPADGQPQTDQMTVNDRWYSSQPSATAAAGAGQRRPPLDTQWCGQRVVLDAYCKHVAVWLAADSLYSTSVLNWRERKINVNETSTD